MGQANQRGNFTERQANARERNRLVEAELKKNPELEKVRRKLGTQRFVTRMIASQMISR